MQDDHDWMGSDWDWRSDTEKTRRCKSFLKKQRQKRRPLRKLVKAAINKGDIPCTTDVDNYEAVCQSIRHADALLVYHGRRARCPFISGRQKQECPWVAACEACDPDPENPPRWRRWCFNEHHKQSQGETDVEAAWLKSTEREKWLENRKKEAGKFDKKQTRPCDSVNRMQNAGPSKASQAHTAEKPAAERCEKKQQEQGTSSRKHMTEPAAMEGTSKKQKNLKDKEPLRVRFEQVVHNVVLPVAAYDDATESDDPEQESGKDSGSGKQAINIAEKEDDPVPSAPPGSPQQQAVEDDD
jgi:hypothetical protein